MKRLLTKESLQIIVLTLTIVFFGIFYWQTVMNLPLFGDATIHGTNANALLEGGWKNIEADYPSYYSYIMALLFTLYGEKGYNLTPFFGFIFLLFASFLFIKQVTKNYYLGLLGIIFVACSPKVIFYSARMYQEILISGLVIFTIYLLFRFFDYKKNVDLILIAIFTGLTLSVKQQGLLILFPAIIFYFFLELLRKKNKF